MKIMMELLPVFLTILLTDVRPRPALKSMKNPVNKK
jgi:hypothetical protein